MTPQQKALALVKKKFGNTGFTEHHINYCRVGFKSGGKTLSAMGDTWQRAISVLERTGTKVTLTSE